MLRIFDFDGTLVDLWPRYYAVFCEILSIDISFDEYRKVKKNFGRDSLVASKFGRELPKDYFERKEQLLEDKSFLEYDKLVFSRNELSMILNNDSIILTKRRNADNFCWELERLGLEMDYQVVSTGTKEEWVRKNVNGNCIVVGDSLDDLRIGNNSRAEVFMVGYGLGRKEDFDKENVNYTLFETPKELVSFWGRI